MDLNKLTLPERIISAAAIVLFLDMWLPWFKIDFLGQSISWNGWDVGLLASLPTIIGLVMLAHVVLTKLVTNVSVPDLPWPRIHLIGGIVAGALLVLKVLVGATASRVDLDRAYGLFLGALCGIALAVGGFLYSKDAEGATNL